MPLLGSLVDYMAEEGTADLEDMTVETYKTEKQREQRLNKTRKSKNCRTTIKDVTYA